MMRVVPPLLALMGLTLLVVAFYPAQAATNGPVRLADLVEKLTAAKSLIWLYVLPAGVPLNQGLPSLIAADFDDGSTAEFGSVTSLDCFPNNLKAKDVAPSDIVGATVEEDPEKPGNRLF